MAAVATRRRKGQRGKSIEELIPYAIGHRTRCQILIVLNQGTYSASELSEILDVPLNSLANHVTELAEGGLIEVVEERRRRNTLQSFYRALVTPEISKEEQLKMTPRHRQMLVGVAVQGLLAEVMESFWTEKISRDPDHCFVWDRIHIDEQGRQDLTNEQTRHRERVAQIEAESLVRSNLEETETTPFIVSVLGFERGKKAPVASGVSI